MDIYQCMTCGERWAHGTETAIQIAGQHQAKGHAVYIGNIDRLAQQYASQNGKKLEIAPELSNPTDPESKLGGTVDIWGSSGIESAFPEYPREMPSAPVSVAPTPHNGHTEDTPGIFVVRQFRQWLCSEENELGFEHEAGRYLSAQAWRYLAAMIDKVHGLPS